MCGAARDATIAQRLRDGGVGRDDLINGPADPHGPFGRTNPISSNEINRLQVWARMAHGCMNLRW
jgi:hypothetical protein